MGQGSPDHVFILAPQVDTTYAITLVPQAFDAVLYVLSDCGAAQQSCVAASDGTGIEHLSLEVQGGQSRYLVVDGTLNSNAAGGLYTLEVVVE